MARRSNSCDAFQRILSPATRTGASGATRTIPMQIPGAAKTCSTFIRKQWRRQRMERHIRSGERRSGFTLIELMIVMAIIGILLSIALPIYNKSIIRAKESVLRNNLFTLRNVIDEYTYDKQKAPQSLDDLVSAGYLRQIPGDPMTGASDWKVIMEDAMESVDQNEPGVFDVKSGSDKTSLEGD